MEDTPHTPKKRYNLRKRPKKKKVVSSDSESSDEMIVTIYLVAQMMKWAHQKKNLISENGNVLWENSFLRVQQINASSEYPR